MRACEDQNAPRVIVGNFTLYRNEMHALIDPSSTHSYVCIKQLSDKMPSVESLAYDMHVTSLLGHNREFSVYLIALPFHEFNFILGMDWLSKQSGYS